MTVGQASRPLKCDPCLSDVFAIARGCYQQDSCHASSLLIGDDPHRSGWKFRSHYDDWVEDLLVVVVTYNSSHVIDGLLDSLPAAMSGARAVVVVVDNGSTDGTVDRVRARSDCRLLEQPNRGYSAGINAGIEFAGGVDPILILNPDTRLRPGALRPMLAALREPCTGVVAPLVLNDDGTVFHSLRREPTLLRASGLGFTGRTMFSEYVSDEAAYQQDGVYDWALGAALLLSRDCYVQLGGWVEDYFLYSEETDYCLRARDMGWVLRFVPQAVVVHIGGQSGRSDRTHVMQILNRVRLYRRRRGVALGWCYFALTVLSESTWALRGHRESRAALKALFRRSCRPPELGLSATSRMLPD